MIVELKVSEFKCPHCNKQLAEEKIIKDSGVWEVEKSISDMLIKCGFCNQSFSLEIRINVYTDQLD